MPYFSAYSESDLKNFEKHPYKINCFSAYGEKQFKKAINKKGEINMSKKISRTTVTMLRTVYADTS